MSDKKFNFLNNIIFFTISIVISPIKEREKVVYSLGRGKTVENCRCFEGKSKTSYKQVLLKKTENEGKCLFYAAELAREYADTHEYSDIDSDQTVNELNAQETTSKNEMLKPPDEMLDKRSKKGSMRRKFSRKYKNHEKKLHKSVKKLMKKTIEGLNKQDVIEGFGPDFTKNVYFIYFM